MFTTRNIICAFALVLIASPSFGQSPTRKMADPHALEKARQKQSILIAGRELAPIVAKDRNAAGWLDISAAPDFPVPLFRGNSTRFMKVYTGADAALEETMNKYGRQMIMETQDSPYIVYQWYSRYLPAAGYKLDERYPKQAPGGRAYMVKGDTDKSQAIVTISPKNDMAMPGSQITVMVMPKVAVPVMRK